MNRRDNLTVGLALVALVALGIQFFLGREDNRAARLVAMTAKLESLERLKRSPGNWAAFCNHVGATRAALKDLQDFLAVGIRLHIDLHPDATEERLALFTRAANLAKAIKEHTRRTK